MLLSISTAVSIPVEAYLGCSNRSIGAHSFLSLDENLEFRSLLHESRLFGEAISTLIQRRGLDWGRSVVDRLLVSF